MTASTTWYYYNGIGNAIRVLSEQDGSNMFTATRFGYATDAETATFVLGETWTWDGASNCETSGSYDITFGREFRYDSGRARYLNRELDPQALEAAIYTALRETWSDYDGDAIYGDDNAVGDPIRSFEPGLATVEPWRGGGPGSTTYLHSDHLGSLRETTGVAASELRVYTAFGDPVTSRSDRYGYVGGLGYQQTIDQDTGANVFPYLHLGYRYYDPSSGRFLQRDPIGLVGGPNVYEYAGSLPTLHVDPDGLWLGGAIRGAIKIGNWCRACPVNS